MIRLSTQTLFSALSNDSGKVQETIKAAINSGILDKSALLSSEGTPKSLAQVMASLVDQLAKADGGAKEIAIALEKTLY